MVICIPISGFRKWFWKGKEYSWLVGENLAFLNKIDRDRGAGLGLIDYLGYLDVAASRLPPRGGLGPLRKCRFEVAARLPLRGCRLKSANCNRLPPSPPEDIDLDDIE